MTNTLKTTLRVYLYDIREPEEAAAYEALCAKLASQGLKCMESWGGAGHYHGIKKLAGEIELESRHLFNDQWNTPTHRVFDWAQDYPIDFSKSIKRGHYLDQTPEMREARRNTVKCRYCGAQEPAAKGYVFCPHCIGGQYLTAKDLPLTRMKAIDDNSNCALLTDAERAHLMPLWKDAQLHGHAARDKARIAKARADVEAKYLKALQTAEAEHKGFLWLMDHGIRTDNVIYYSHTGQFGFGWRKPLEAEELSAWLDIASEFPFEYEIKKA
jgi:hypothetical protein